MDIGSASAISITPEVPIDQILFEAGDQAPHHYRMTPLEFAAREDWPWSIYWTYWMGCLRNLTGITFVSKVRPIDKIPDDYFPVLDPFSTIVLFLFQTGYASVHISGWNFHFPTPVEKRLWHLTTLGIISAILGYWVVQSCAIDIPNWLRKRRGDDLSTKVFHDAEAPPTTTGFRSRLRRALMNTSHPYDSSKDIPLRANVPVLICVFIYSICRGYVLLEGFVNLRALPRSAYESVDWTLFLPHF